MTPPPVRRMLRALPSGPAADSSVVDGHVVEPTDPAAEAATGRESTLGAAVAALLSALGRNRHHVAQTLSAAGMRGWPGDPDMDPLCRWLHREIPDAGVWLTTGEWLRVWVPRPDGRRDTADVRLPAPVADYARHARAEGFPFLRLGYTPPAVPVPHVASDAGIPAPPWYPTLLRYPADSAPAQAPTTLPGPAADPTPPSGDAAAAPTPAPSTVGGVPSAERTPPPVAGDQPAGDRGMAHQAYGDAVAFACEVRGVQVREHGAWPVSLAGSPALRAEGRRITITFEPELWAQALPGAAQVVLHWSERHGWCLVTITDDGHADADATLSWWDWADPHAAVLPAPARLAMWVAAVAAHGPDVGACLTGAQVAVGDRPLWRDDTREDPAFEAALHAYRTSAGHRFAAQDRYDGHADTVWMTPVAAGATGSRP